MVCSFRQEWCFENGSTGGGTEVTCPKFFGGAFSRPSGAKPFAVSFLGEANAPLVLACDRNYTAKLGLSLSPRCQINRLQDLAKGQESAISKWSETPILLFPVP